MPRSKVVTVNGKTITVREQRIGELETLADKLGTSVDVILTANAAGDLKRIVKTVLTEKVPELFPELTPDDVLNAYPSEIEALVEAFVDVNFFGLKRLAGPVLGLIQAGLSRR